MFLLKSLKRGSYPIVLAIVLMTCLTFLGGCGGGGEDYIPQEGDSFEATFSVASGDNTVSSVTMSYKAYDLASGDEEPVIVLLAVSEDLGGASTGRSASKGDALQTIEDWQRWLDENWDPYIGPDNDPGIDAAEFIAYLEDHHISGQTFVNLYESSGMASMEEFMAFAGDVTAAIAEDNDPLSDLEWFLEQLPRLSSQDVSMDLGVFLGELEVAYPLEGYEGFLDWVIEEELDFHGLYGRYFEYLMDLWNDDTSDPLKQNFHSFLSAVVAGELAANSKTGDDDKKTSGLDVAKFAWDVIKDGKPKTDIQGAFTSVLAEGDKNPLNYGYAVNDQTMNVSFTLENLFGMSLVDANYRGECTYGALHPSYGGHFLPNVHFKVNKSYAMWSWNLDVSAQVSNVSNIGGFAEPNPQIDMDVTLKAGSLLQNFTRTTTFRAVGIGGISIVD